MDVTSDEIEKVMAEAKSLAPAADASIPAPAPPPGAATTGQEAAPAAEVKTQPEVKNPPFRITHTNKAPFYVGIDMLSKVRIYGCSVG